jgi:hypothetical protein
VIGKRFSDLLFCTIGFVVVEMVDGVFISITGVTFISSYRHYQLKRK